MAEKKEDMHEVRGESSYVLGIVSIVLAFFIPLAGLIFGIVGLSLSKQERTSLGKKAQKLSKIGIVISIIVIILLMLISILAEKYTNLSNFPLR